MITLPPCPRPGGAKACSYSVIREAVGDHPGDVQPALQQHRHRVPGLEHLPAVDALDGQHVEHHRGEVDADLLGRQPEHGDPAPVGHLGDHLPQRGRAARTSPGPTSKPSCMSSSRWASASRSRPTRTARLTPSGLGQRQPLRAQVGDHHVPGPGVPADHGGQDADRPGAGDQHVLAQHREGQGGVHRVAERVEDRGHPPVDRMPVHPRIARRHGDVLRERPIDLHPDAPGVDAQVAASGPAVPAAPAHQMPLAADRVADRARRSRRSRPRPPRRRTHARPSAGSRPSAPPTGPRPRCAGRSRRCPWPARRRARRPVRRRCRDLDQLEPRPGCRLDRAFTGATRHCRKRAVARERPSHAGGACWTRPPLSTRWSATRPTGRLRARAAPEMGEAPAKYELAGASAPLP